MLCHDYLRFLENGLFGIQFSIFLNDLESEYSGLPYFTEVR